MGIGYVRPDQFLDHLTVMKSSWPKKNVSNSSQIIQWSSEGHITIHFRGSLPKQGPQRSSFLRKRPYLRNRMSYSVGSGGITTVRPRATSITRSSVFRLVSKSGIHFVCFMCIDWMATCEAERHMLLEANKVPKIPASK